MAPLLACPGGLDHGLQVVYGHEAQSGAELVDGGDDARGVTGPPRDDFVVHLEYGDLADGAEHLEDAEAFPRPMLYVALGAPACRPRAAARWAWATSET